MGVPILFIAVTALGIGFDGGNLRFEGGEGGGATSGPGGESGEHRWDCGVGKIAEG